MNIQIESGGFYGFFFGFFGTFFLSMQPFKVVQREQRIVILYLIVHSIETDD